jgi:hypothetical protein
VWSAAIATDLFFQRIPDSGIEISVEVPNHQKKKKKGFDVEAYLKKEMAKVQREVQVNPSQGS